MLINRKKRARKWNVCNFSCAIANSSSTCFCWCQKWVGLDDEYLNWAGKRKKGLVCIYVNVCDGPALFLGYVAQSVPSSVCPFPSYFGSFAVLPLFPPLSSCFIKIEATISKTKGTCISLEKHWVVPSHPSICFPSRSTFSLLLDVHKRITL